MMNYFFLVPLLLIWITYNPSMVKLAHASNVWDESTSPFPNFNGITVEVLEWISNFLLRFIGRVITYTLA